MKLFSKIGKGLKRDMTIEDEFGRPLLAADVFGISIKFLVDDMLNAVNKAIDGVFKPSEINVVITVPAIWSDAAKQFMREATEKAGISKERLTIALEPEVASLYCRHLHIHKPCELSNACMDKLPMGTKYIVLDAGGGTIDVTVHETKSEHTLREVRPASGGDWGGIMVDKEFEHLIERIVGENVFEKFKQEEHEDWFDMQREFESKKREANMDSAGKIRMRFPLSLTKLYEKHMKQDICTSLASSGYAGKINVINDKMTISNTILVELFDKSVIKTISHLKSLLAEGSFKEARILLMVGGYSESLVLQHAVIEALPEIQVVIPRGASSIVLRGALIYGHNPSSISERILKYTYGTDISKPFIEGIHQENKRFISKGGEIRCLRIFSKFVTMGHTVKTGETKVTNTYTCSTLKGQNSGFLNIYASEERDPLYTDDDGCHMIGRLRMDFDEDIGERKRNVTLSLFFGGTEIIVELEDQCTGKRKITSVDFLG